MHSLNMFRQLEEGDIFPPSSHPTRRVLISIWGSEKSFPGPLNGWTGRIVPRRGLRRLPSSNAAHDRLS